MGFDLKMSFDASASSLNVPLEPAPEGLSSDQALYMAKVAESAERYDEMTRYMVQSVANLKGDELSVEQRNLISVGYKNLMSARRTAWRVTAQSIDMEREPALKQKGMEYQEKIATELKGLVTAVVNDVVGKFVKGPSAAVNTEVLVFFHKMEGDYNRYGAEITDGEEKKEFAGKAEAAYAKATKLGMDPEDGGLNLPPTNPIRLGLALNYSVFMYEILEEKNKAMEVAKSAFDDAIAKIDELDEEQYRDSTLIMQLLKDNLSLWGEASEGEDDYHGDRGYD